MVTVEIPGVPNYVGSDLGKTQDAVALAFYHYQVYSCDITPPVDEDEATLAEVCGWEQSKTGIPDDDPEPDPPPDPVQEYGCIDYYPLAPAGSPVTEPWFFREKCCVDGQHDGCKVRTSRLEGGKDLDEVTRARLTANWAGPIEFIGLGPITPAGCGTRYEETVVRPQNCCDDAEPIVWDSDNSVEVLADNTSGLVFVIGGVAPYYWSIRGQGMTFDNWDMREAITDVPYIRVFARDACGWCPIEVTDTCSISKYGIRSANGNWYEVASDYYPNCLPKPPELFICNSYNPGSVSANSTLNGQWWAGLYSQNPPEVSGISFSRGSHTCGMWAATDGSDTILAVAPGSNGQLLIPILRKLTVAHCIDGNGVDRPGMTLYAHPLSHNTFQWRC